MSGRGLSRCRPLGRLRSAGLALALVFGSASPLSAAPVDPQSAPRALERLERAEASFGEADFDGAELEAIEVLRSGALSSAGVARAHLLLGMIAAARGDEAGAERDMRRALRLHPGQELPKTAGPHVVAAFRNARSTVAAQDEFAVRIELGTTLDELELEVRAAITGESDGLLRGIVIEAPGFRRHLEVPEGRRTLREDVAFPPGGCRTFVASAADEFGNRLWPESARIDVCPASRAPRLATEAASVPPRSTAHPANDGAAIPEQVWIAGGVTAALVVATTVLGLHALDARSEYQDSLADPALDADTRWALHERAESAQHHATFAGLLAGASGVTTVLLYAFRPTAGVRANVSLANGARVSAGFRF